MSSLARLREEYEMEVEVEEAEERVEYDDRFYDYYEGKYDEAVEDTFINIIAKF